MATPGIGDPYWFEWYVGLKNIINMLNPDNGIEYVIFQCSKYNTIDDVVVGYKDGGHEICYQIKHEIFTSKTQNLTFGKLLEQETKTKPCLLCAIAQGWQAARASAENQIKPILYTNRTLGPNRATRTFNGKSYSSYPIKKFFEKVKTALNKLPEGAEVSFEDKTLQTQWEEMCAAIDTLDTATIVAFSKAFEIQGNQLGLLDTEHELITSLAKTFACSDNLAKELFIKLAAALRKWTTTSRANEKIFIEDVYSILGAESEPDLSPHRLAPPFPFFETWRYEGFEDILKPLIAASNREGFWLLAKIIGQNLSEYNYQISVRNMQLLLKLFCCCEEPKLQNLFEQELSTQEMWITGNKHINPDFKIIPVLHDNTTPTSYAQYAFMVLMEQIETHNARKIEGAIYSIYNLGKHFGEIFTVLSEKWSTYSDFQKDTLLVIIARWFFDQIDGLDHLREIVLLEYRNCSSLTRKYYLHSILTSDSKSDISASEAIYTPSSSNCDFPGTPSNVISRRVDRFLEFIEEWYDYPHMNDDLRICIKRSGCKENYGVDNFQKIGDCLLPAAIDEEDRILYSAEKDGRWVEIPLLQKKCWLLPSDDPYLLTEMPHMVFDDSWFPCISDSYGEKSDIRINKDQFSKIVHGNRPVGEIVLGACVWYPWNDDDGKLYIETAKIDTNTLSPYRSDKVDPCFGNYGLLAHEGALVEFGGDFAHINGASLFKVVGGNMFFYLCNSQIAPSEIWREGFKCVPDHTSPYCWRDENGNIVLRFERIASPIREAMHEKYYRQPILFRWLCNSEWLKETLCKHNLHLRYVSRLESIP